MTDLICKNTMRQCQTPGMCSPFGGCREVELVSSVWLEQLRSEFRAAVRDRDRLQAENEALRALLDTPHTADWFEGVKLEAGHQIKRWGTQHDAGKTPADWFWLIGYLAQKAMTAQMTGDELQARHHTISTGAAMLNWFRAIVGDSTDMRPGIEAQAEDVPDFTPGNGNKARRRADALGIDYAAAMAKGAQP